MGKIEHGQKRSNMRIPSHRCLTTKQKRTHRYRNWVHHWMHDRTTNARALPPPSQVPKTSKEGLGIYHWASQIWSYCTSPEPTESACVSWVGTWKTTKVVKKKKVSIKIWIWARPRKNLIKNRWKKNSHPLNSRKRQITLATISSLFSSGGGGGVLLPLVRLASRSVAVAPKHNAKSSVADYKIIAGRKREQKRKD